jgi:uncharacterized Ntn-hydrolase superfamily protein
MTFSISALCPETGTFGIAISSSSPAVAARCAHARAKAGVIATQNITDPELGQIGLDLLARGKTAEEVRAALVACTAFSDYRQLAVVDSFGRTATFSGKKTLGIYAAHEGPGAVAAGNLLANVDVPAAMIKAFESSSGSLGHRLLRAMQAGLDQGGEAGPVHSAGMLLVRDVSWPIADLRVDWSDAPIAALQDAWAVYEPQLEDYVRRARQPAEAPSFGVAGDE